MTAVVVRCAYMDTSFGQVHYAESGRGPTVLLLHQTPRSWDEFRDVLPLLADAGFRAVAMDTLGYGGSAAVEPSIQTWAAAAVELLHGISAGPAVVVGHHTGGVIALEVAARAPELVRALVLSSTPVVDEEFRSRPHGVDEVTRSPDGEHVKALWAGRASFYPTDSPDLLERFVADALIAGLDRSAAGHAAVRHYRMEERLPLVHAPILLIGAPEDPYGYPNFQRMQTVFPGAAAVEIPGGMVPLPDQKPDEYAAAIVDYVCGLTDNEEPA